MRLEEFFKENPRLAVAFSGGVDSAYLLYEASRLAREVKAYYVKTAFQPDFELEDARRFAKLYGINMSIIELDVLECERVILNPANRCYYCKQIIFDAIWKAAVSEGFEVLADGTNASDDADDRPGMKALQELKVLSPLRLCALTKNEIRQRSKQAGLFTHDKPAYACLATRIRTGEVITADKLKAAETSEKLLFSLGIKNLRVRRVKDAARIQVPAQYMETVIKNREKIVGELKKYYSDITLDLEARQ